MKVDILCLGTPKITGDSIGPLVGTILGQCPFDDDVKIIGNMHDPVVMSNYYTKIKMIRPGAFVIVVDASLDGVPGLYGVFKEPMHPGSGLSTGIKPIGDVSIKCYTGRTISDMHSCNSSLIGRLALRVSTGLMDLISFYKNKDIYSNNI